MATCEQLVRDFPMPVKPLRLKIRRVRAADFRPLIPFEPEPVHRLENARNHFLRRPLRIRVLDPKNKRSAMTPRKQPVE